MIFLEFSENFRNNFSIEHSWRDVSDFILLVFKNFQTSFINL